MPGLTGDTKVSSATLQKFSDIFSFWIRKIKDGEEDTVEAGELCIRPLANNEGAILYWRDPETGELITPNTLEDLEIILNHFNKEDGTMSADLIGGIRFYTNIFDLPVDDGVNLTPDTVISHMVDKSIMISPINFPDDYKVVNYPTPNGLLTITKMSNGVVRAEFTDAASSNTWTGVYNAETHEFIRWQLSEDVNANYITLSGDPYKVRGDSDTPVTDFEVWNIKTPDFTVQPDATMQINESEYLPFIEIDGTPISESVPANSIIMVTYDSYRKSWVRLTEDRSIASQLMQIMSIRLSSQTGDLTTLINETKQFIEDTKDTMGAMKDRIEELERGPARIIYTSFVIPITDENSAAISLTTDQATVGLDIILINLEQTILQLGVDYTLDEQSNSIIFASGCELTPGYSIQIIVIKQPK